ncbi:MAG: glycosyltransferase family 9 protein [Candidatus Hydrogenedens sp.]|jgi:lipopolysaccharide heptosyltransferase I|nr:glycosyltransferase family 9 protein [Candidatus Hydrogenedens sp.]
MLNGVPRILIIRFSAIGDVVRVLPALHALRDAYPHAQIDWAIEPKSLDIISGHPALDQIHVFERPEGFRAGIRAFRSFCRTLRDGHYDMVLDFHGIFKSGYAMGATRAATRTAFAAPRSRELSHWFANQRVTLPDQVLNRIEENLILAAATGASGSGLEVTIAVPDEVQEAVESFIHDTFQSAKRLVIVHAPVERAEKQWPLNHYAALVDMLLSDGRFDVLLTWGPGQRKIVEKVHAKCKRNPVIAPEMPSLKYFSWLARQADLYFGGDTGPMHIASAMDVPVVAVFGGTSPKRHHPFREPSQILYAAPEKKTENMTPQAAREYLEKITAEEAYDACTAMIKRVEGQGAALMPA